MELSSSDISGLAGLGRTLAHAPAIEIVVATVFEALEAVLRIKEVRLVCSSGSGAWTEWVAERNAVNNGTLRAVPRPDSRGSFAHFEGQEAHSGFIWAHPKTIKTTQTLTLIAPQIWTAIMLRTALDRTNRSSRSENEVIRETLRTRDEERRRIARELHDDLGQSLASLKLNLKWIEDRVGKRGGLEDAASQLTESRNEVGSMLGKIRDLSHTLYPRILDTLGLAAAIKELVHQMGRHSGLQVSCSTEGRERKLSKEAAVGLYRCGQEALSNALRHSNASEIQVTIVFTSSEVRLKVKDDGKGFDPRALYDSGVRIMSSGFWTIRQRMTALGGSFRISTTRGQGTSVETIVPLKTVKKHSNRSTRKLSPR